MFVRKNQLFALIALALIPFSSSVMAATATSTMTVSTNVVQACRIASTTNLSFGTYDPTSANRLTALNATNTVAISCVAQSTGVELAFDEGLNKDASSTCQAPVRRMTNADGSFLKYNLYQNSSRNLVWGCASGANTKAFTSASFPNTDAVSVTQYGTIPAGQDIVKGAYTDTVGVTVSF